MALKAHRLVTLAGVGGVGKTRLTLEVAVRMTDSFADGVWLIELAPVGGAAAVPHAVAAVLGITQQPGMSVADSVAAALEGRSRLLMFDNWNMSSTQPPSLSRQYCHSATVKILATSREGLRAADEQLWPVPSLNTGFDSSAATLFIERAQSVAPGTGLAGTDDVVVEICRRLDD